MAPTLYLRLKRMKSLNQPGGESVTYAPARPKNKEVLSPKKGKVWSSKEKKLGTSV